MDVIGLDLYAEDLTIYSSIPSGSTNNIKQIRDYVRDRLAYVDAEIAALDAPAEEIPCTGITLDQTELAFDGAGTQTLIATVTPSDTTDAVVWSTDADTVATVSGGVVTAKANGSATITATCGSYSATCTVSVSGIAEESSEIDYTKDALTGVSWNDGYTYNKSTGVLTATDNEHCSDKFALQNCQYVFSCAGATWTQVFVWDENGDYAGYFQNAAGAGTPSDFHVWGVTGYKYAIKYYSATNTGVSVTMIPVDNSEDYETATVELTTANVFVTGNGKLEIVGINHGITARDKIKSVNYPTFQLFDSYENSWNKPVFQINVWNNAVYIVNAYFGANVDAMVEYYADKEPLTIT